MTVPEVPHRKIQEAGPPWDSGSFWRDSLIVAAMVILATLAIALAGRLLLERPATGVGESVVMIVLFLGFTVFLGFVLYRIHEAEPEH